MLGKRVLLEGPKGRLKAEWFLGDYLGRELTPVVQGVFHLIAEVLLDVPLRSWSTAEIYDP